MGIEFKTVKLVLDSLVFEYHRVPGTNLTACWALLPDGSYVASGESVAALDTDFNAELGKQYARDKAIANATDKIYEFLGMSLRFTGMIPDMVKEAQCNAISAGPVGMNFDEMVTLVADTECQEANIEVSHEHLTAATIIERLDFKLKVTADSVLIAKDELKKAIHKHVANLYEPLRNTFTNHPDLQSNSVIDKLVESQLNDQSAIQINHDKDGIRTQCTITHLGTGIQNVKGYNGLFDTKVQEERLWEEVAIELTHRALLSRDAVILNFGIVESFVEHDNIFEVTVSDLCKHHVVTISGVDKTEVFAEANSLFKRNLKTRLL